jgi:hypothetical protein
VGARPTHLDGHGAALEVVSCSRDERGRTLVSERDSIRVGQR